MKTYDERMQSVQRKLARKQTKRKALMATAGALCICLVIGLVFPKGNNEIEPGIDISKYSNSEYIKVIEAINRDFPKRQENNWFEDLMEGDLVYGGDMNLSGAVPEVPGSSNAPIMQPSAGVEGNVNTSFEITDNQVAGVLEADIIKRSQTHIFYLKNNTLEVYPIAGLDTKLLNTWCLDANENAYYYSTEMYLSTDATRINLVISGLGEVFEEEKKSAFVQVISLDVTDPANIQQVNCLYVTGSLLSSRMVGDRMLLMAQYCMDNDIDFEKESTFLPQYGQPKEMKTIPADHIVVPEKLSDKTYTVVTLLDGKDMTIVDSGAFMSYSSQVYVSQERIYATRSYMNEVKVDSSNALVKEMTEVSCMGYDENGLTLAGTFCVEGTVKDQYSMDEFEGVFRIVTATNRREMVIYENRCTTMTMAKRNANLTCYKVGTWEQLAQVAQFAPDGETVESVRFDGDYAYVCTAVVVTLTDPVFFFDMTDLNNIIVKDTGTIDGYSSSLIQLNDGFLMGIGYNDKLNLKVEIYEETENGVASVCEYVKVDRFAIEYKAYYIDRVNNLFGIPTGNGYILLQFDGYQLNLLAYAGTKGGYYIGELDYFRGLVIDKCLYVFGPDYFSVQEIG